MDYIQARVVQMEAMSSLFKLDPGSAEFATAMDTVQRRHVEAEAALSAFKRVVEQQ